MRIVIVGSRTYEDEGAVRAFVRTLEPGTVVVSGGAEGPDSWAADEARSIGLSVSVHEADWEKLGRRAGPLRNDAIVADADSVVAFWDGKSHGTAYTVTLAVHQGKPVQVLR